MGKIKFEVFNVKTGKFEDGILNEEEAMNAIEGFRNDYESYEAEKDIV